MQSIRQVPRSEAATHFPQVRLTVLDELTREEARVVSYEGNEPPTRAELVTPETPLEALNLNWKERDLPEWQRTKHVHRLHPYLGKFIPQIVEVFLRKYFSAGDVVADPFAGSGTTLVQAAELGIDSIGFDISAFNVMLASAKTSHYELESLARDINHVRGTTELLHNKENVLPGLEFSDDSGTDEEGDAYLNAWFAPRALSELLTFRRLIESCDIKHRDVLRVFLSRAARSARLTSHFDLDFPKKPIREPYYCYKHSRMCQPTTDALKFLRRYSEDTIKRIAAYQQLRTHAKAEVHHADSRTCFLPEIKGIITSPPYVGLIDYHEQHAYAYSLFGLEDRRALEIGPAARGSSIIARKRYQEDIVSVFSHFLAAMPSGGPMIVIAGDKHGLYGEIADTLGVEVEAVVQRHVNRRTGRRSNEFYESVFVWRKR
jgi:hypothetical protein